MIGGQLLELLLPLHRTLISRYDQANEGTILARRKIGLRGYHRKQGGDSHNREEGDGGEYRGEVYARELPLASGNDECLSIRTYSIFVQFVQVVQSLCTYSS